MSREIKVYLAGRYESQDVMRQCRDVWQEGGRVVITSRWIDGKHDGVPPIICAVDDFEDIDAAGALVLWSPREHFRTGRGGRHVELGYALAREKRVIVVGERENVFHWHPAVEHAADFPDAYRMLLAPAGSPQGEACPRGRDDRRG